MPRSGLILVHPARHCTAKLLEFITQRGAVGLTAFAARRGWSNRVRYAATISSSDYDVLLQG